MIISKHEKKVVQSHCTKIPIPALNEAKVVACYTQGRKLTDIFFRGGGGMKGSKFPTDKVQI